MFIAEGSLFLETILYDGRIIICLCACLVTGRLWGCHRGAWRRPQHRLRVESGELPIHLQQRLLLQHPGHHLWHANGAVLGLWVRLPHLRAHLEHLPLSAGLHDQLRMYAEVLWHRPAVLPGPLLRGLLPLLQQHRREKNIRLIYIFQLYIFQLLHMVSPDDCLFTYNTCQHYLCVDRDVSHLSQSQNPHTQRVYLTRETNDNN